VGTASGNHELHYYYVNRLAMSPDGGTLLPEQGGHHRSVMAGNLLRSVPTVRFNRVTDVNDPATTQAIASG
jgi:hypothetical protein